MFKSMLPNQSYELNLINKAGIETLNIPTHSYGVIPAHSYKKFDIIITNISPNTTLIPILFELSKTPSMTSKIDHFLLAHSKRKLKVTGNTFFENYPLIIDIPKFSDALSKSEIELAPEIKKTKNNVKDFGSPFREI